MKLVFLLLAAGTALAQTSRYPGSLDSDTSLFVVSDNVQTNLNAAMGTSDTAAVVVSATGFVPNMIATICDTTTNTGKCTAWEHMLVTSVSGNILTVTRGFAGTSARAHSSGRLVSVLIDATHQKVLKDSVVAIETALGPSLSNIATGGAFLNSANYVWSAQTCAASMVCSVGGASGASLIAGNNTLTMTPVPKGINGSDTNHRLYVSGGTGSAEGCMITGGSGTSGQPSGQIIMNCGSAHTGGFTIQSMDGGIQEAIQAAVTAGGGTVQVPAGIYTCYGATVVPSKVRLTGAGRSATTLQVSNAQIIPWWAVPGSNYAVIAATSADSIEVAGMTVDLGTPAVTLSAFSALGLTNSYIHDMAVVNPRQTGGLTTMFNTTAGTANYNNVFAGNFAYLGGGCADNNGPGGFGLSNSFGTRVINNYAEGGCVGSFMTSFGSDNIFQGNVFKLASGTMSAGNQAYMADNSFHNTFVGNLCIGNGTGPACFTMGADNTTQPNSNVNVFTGNLASNCGYGFLISGANPAARTHSGTVVQGNSIAGCAVGIQVQAGPGSIENTTIANNTIDSSGSFGISVLANVAGAKITGTTIRGNQIRNSVNSGIQLLQNAPNLITQTVMSGNTFNHNNPAGIILNPSAGSPITDGTISGNTFMDTGATPVANSYAVLFIGGASDIYSRWIITDNNFSAQLGIQWPNGNKINNLSFSYIGGNICSGAFCGGLPNGVIYSSAANFADIGICGINNTGAYATVNDSTTATWGAAITGGGTARVMAYCNGTNWTVAAK